MSGWNNKAWNEGACSGKQGEGHFLRINKTACAGHTAANRNHAGKTGNHAGKTRNHAGMNRSHAGQTRNNTVIGRNAHELWTYDEDLRLTQQAGMDGCMENTDLL
jgi:hypothetical protein